MHSLLKQRRPQLAYLIDRSFRPAALWVCVSVFAAQLLLLSAETLTPWQITALWCVFWASVVGLSLGSVISGYVRYLRHSYMMRHVVEGIQATLHDNAAGSASEATAGSTGRWREAAQRTRGSSSLPPASRLAARARRARLLAVAFDLADYDANQRLTAPEACDLAQMLLLGRDETSTPHRDDLLRAGFSGELDKNSFVDAFEALLAQHQAFVERDASRARSRHAREELLRRFDWSKEARRDANAVVWAAKLGTLRRRRAVRAPTVTQAESSELGVRVHACAGAAAGDGCAGAPPQSVSDVESATGAGGPAQLSIKRRASIKIQRVRRQTHSSTA